MKTVLEEIKTMDVKNNQESIQLSSLEHPFLSDFELTEFVNIEDSFLYYKGLQKAAQSFQLKPKLFDLGFGSSVTGITLLKNDYIDSVKGIDIDPQAILVSMYNAKRHKVNPQKIQLVSGDIRGQLQVLNGNTDILGANLPYLPVPEGFNISQSVNGGLQGLSYIPNIVLLYANKLQAKKIVMNFCSMTSPSEVLKLIEYSDYYIENCIILICPFGEYTQKLISYYESSSKFLYFYNNGVYYQCIINVNLSKTHNNIKPSYLFSLLKNFQKCGFIVNTVPNIEVNYDEDFRNELF